ncbi:acyl dehydratase [Altererythrobacter sp. GH1-8]|uniref:acyl dehydratase n=1 Tax=Altererythrobacter sp. GH1-8 TaxID=3349333 RepID=UPI00374D2F64
MSKITTAKPDDVLPGRAYRPDNVQNFMYSAALWNAHRIHFDMPYATEVEGYPGIVVSGPMLGDWLTQCVIEWLDGKGRMTHLEYSNRKAAFIGETVTSGGRVISVDHENNSAEVELFIKNEAGEVIVPGTAVVAFGND